MKNPGKFRLEPTAPSRSEDIVLYQLTQILNRTQQNRWFIGEFSLILGACLSNQRRKPQRMLIMDNCMKECRAFDVDLHCNTFKIRFRTVFSQAYGGACRRDRTRKTQLPKADTDFFFFWPEKKGGSSAPSEPPLATCLQQP